MVVATRAESAGPVLAMVSSTPWRVRSQEVSPVGVSVADMALIAMMTSVLLSETANPVLVLVGVRVPSVPAGTDDGMVVVF